jgi:hypothetical protein
MRVAFLRGASAKAFRNSGPVGALAGLYFGELAMQRPRTRATYSQIILSWASKPSPDLPCWAVLTGL